MALADDELSMGKNHARNGEWIYITMKKVNILLSMDKDSDWQNYLNQKKKILDGEQLIEKSSVFKVKENSFIPAFLDYDHEMGASPSSKVMTLTYQDHSLRERPGLGKMNHTKPETKESSNKIVSGPVTDQDTEPVTSLVPTKVKTNDQESKINELIKLVQILMDEKINPTQMTQEFQPMNQQPESSKSVNSSKQSQDSKPYGKNTNSSKPVKPKPLQKPMLKCVTIPIIQLILEPKAKPFLPCTHCGFDDHCPDDCKNYPECEICGSYNHFTSRHNLVILVSGGLLAESSQSSESSVGVNLDNSTSNVLIPLDSWTSGLLEYKLPLSRYSFNSKAFRVFNTRRQQIEETYHVTFDESIEAIMFTNTLIDEIRIDDSSRYPPDEFLQEDDLSRQYQSNSDISFYISPHGRSLTELT
ncbi:hypothetical protein Tco_0150793 [Tanacetum coccineum]